MGPVEVLLIVLIIFTGMPTFRLIYYVITFKRSCKGNWEICTRNTIEQSSSYYTGSYKEFEVYISSYLVKDGIFVMGDRRYNCYLCTSEKFKEIEPIQEKGILQYSNKCYCTNSNNICLETHVYVDFMLDRIVFQGRGMLLDFNDYYRAVMLIKEYLLSNSKMGIPKQANQGLIKI